VLASLILYNDRMNVYNLDQERDSEGFYMYQSMYLSDNTEHDQIRYHIEHDGWLNNHQPIGDAWIPVEVEIAEGDEDRLPDSDQPDIGLFSVYAPVFSQKAVGVLADLLEGNGELLPLLCETGTYYVFNVTCEADILNYQLSEFKAFDRKELVPALSGAEPYDVTKFVFYPDKDERLSIFKIPRRGHTRAGFFVTERFVRRVREANLKDFEFQTKWGYSFPVQIIN
jgi:hypothetical protein